MPKGVATGTQITPARKDALRGLMAAGYSRDECCKILRMGSHTYSVLKRQNAPLVERVVRIKKGLAAKKWDIADRASDATTDVKLQALNAYQLAMVSAINIDKALLLEGKATVIVDYKELSKNIIDVDATILDLENQIKELA